MADIFELLREEIKAGDVLVLRQGGTSAEKKAVGSISIEQDI
jgi:hypothetical protein